MKPATSIGTFWYYQHYSYSHTLLKIFNNLQILVVKIKLQVITDKLQKSAVRFCCSIDQQTVNNWYRLKQQGLYIIKIQIMYIILLQYIYIYKKIIISYNIVYYNLNCDQLCYAFRVIGPHLVCTIDTYNSYS